MALAGKDGSFKIGANTVTKIDSWSLEPEADMLDDTALGDSWESKIPGLKRWKFSFEGKWNLTNDANGQTAIQNALLNGTTLAVKLYVDATHYYSGNAYVSSLSIEDPVDDVVTFSGECTGTGALAYT